VSVLGNREERRSLGWVLVLDSIRQYDMCSTRGVRLVYATRVHTVSSTGGVDFRPLSLIYESVW
jgi:hypothetical protein